MGKLKIDGKSLRGGLKENGGWDIERKELDDVKLRRKSKGNRER